MGLYRHANIFHAGKMIIGASVPSIRRYVCDGVF